jgi:DNA/RNA-binding domain of Phe-tRNA-synthetase-like protein
MLIEKKLRDLGLNACLTLVEGVDNTARNDVTKDMEARVEAVRKSLPADAARTLPEILALQSVYKALGIGWRDFRPSIERLISRIQKGRPLPAINPVVDLYNVASVEARMCMGAHDADTIELPIVLRLTRGGETFTPLGRPAESVRAGEFAYFDNLGHIICRLDAVQAEFSKVTALTTRVLLVVEATPVAALPALTDISSATAAQIADATGARVQWMALAGSV